MEFPEFCSAGTTPPRTPRSRGGRGAMGAVGRDELARWVKAEGGGGGAASGGEERIVVSVRVRPLNDKELERGDPSDWECINNTSIIFKNSLPERSMLPIVYAFDRVFGCESSTRQVYEEGAKEVALSVVSGINSSIFAYGQTSSGKTYTMTGITQYSIADIYDYIEKHEEREFVLKFSAMEIYNEAVRDLLSTDSSPLRLLDDPERGTIVEKLTEETLRDQSHLKELLSLCEAQRQIGETSLNEMSSRSHQILRLMIESSAREFLSRDSSSSLAATVNFVDLAGSERASQVLSAGTRLKEGCHINRSLLTLGTVIRKLSKGRNGHIPYRDSKLTRILQYSLGSNARTAIICTMSPARSHIEQSRNTLLFASCAKEVVTNAQVNVVMSDKALVRHLQRELARLESELKYPRSASASCTSPSDVLSEKDVQIKKMEKEIKELMQQRDLAQSRLEDLLQVVGDNRASRQWDECSQSSISNVQNMSEDVLSLSETPEPSDKPEEQHAISPFGFIMYDASYGTSNWNDHHQKLSNKPEEQHAISPWQSISHYQFNGLLPHQRQEGIAQITSDDSEDHCKEVQCIEINGLSASKNEEFNLLLTDESDSLLPLTEADKLADHGPQHLGDVATLPVSERQLVAVTVDNCVKQYPDESSQWSSMRDIMSSRDLALSRSRSCRASLMTGSICWFKDREQNNKTPSNGFLEKFPERVQRRLSTLKHTAENETLSSKASKASDTVAFNRTQDMKTASEEGITSISNFVAELREMAQNQYQKPAPDAQETKRTTSEDFGVEKTTVKDVSLDTISNSLEVPFQWHMEFEKKQQEIVELWHTCNVSLIHRTYFFILFKGDPADSIYMEVEHRRLSFLKNTISHENLDKADAGDGHKRTLASSLRNIRREREMLYRQMFKRIPAEERESLYTNWGIALNSKKRRLQLAQRLWTKTNVEHVRESASLVAKLIGLSEPEQALKEMFGLHFTVTPQRAHRRSYSWKRGNSFVV
ncbi:kinesin-like protein KIN-7F isoform X2 [Phoenix dactylifera]|uniref:Kinesin-like protein n=1 Tax=Phoenix dactylifera TaxID=42345 RepID=A0A8B8ZFY5_PHODC|nr:kinesin-like protein KIN-7F isoform X2 [Phoenix dactylifera]